MKFRDLKRLLEKYGIHWDPAAGKGSHGAFKGHSHVTRQRKVFPVPQDQQREIRAIYLRPLRRTFELTQEHGVSDDLFH